MKCRYNSKEMDGHKWNILALVLALIVFESPASCSKCLNIAHGSVLWQWQFVGAGRVESGASYDRIIGSRQKLELTSPFDLA